MSKKTIFIFAIFQFFVSCGFTPTLKILNDTENDTSVYYEIINTSYNARDTLRNLLNGIDKNSAEYLLEIQVIESESAVNIESNGSVVEYRVEAIIQYKLFSVDKDVLIHSSQTRGLANYDVSSSEYSNALVKKEAQKTAVTEALQLMNIIVQSKINE